MPKIGEERQMRDRTRRHATSIHKRSIGLELQTKCRRAFLFYRSPKIGSRCLGLISKFPPGTNLLIPRLFISFAADQITQITILIPARCQHKASIDNHTFTERVKRNYLAGAGESGSPTQFAAPSRARIHDRTPAPCPRARSTFEHPRRVVAAENNFRAINYYGPAFRGERRRRSDAKHYDDDVVVDAFEFSPWRNRSGFANRISAQNRYTTAAAAAAPCAPRGALRPPRAPRPTTPNLEDGENR